MSGDKSKKISFYSVIPACLLPTGSHYAAKRRREGSGNMTLTCNRDWLFGRFSSHQDGESQSSVKRVKKKACHLQSCPPSALSISYNIRMKL